MCVRFELFPALSGVGNEGLQSMQAVSCHAISSGAGRSPAYLQVPGTAVARHWQLPQDSCSLHR